MRLTQSTTQSVDAVDILSTTTRLAISNVMTVLLGPTAPLQVHPPALAVLLDITVMAPLLSSIRRW